MNAELIRAARATKNAIRVHGSNGNLCDNELMADSILAHQGDYGEDGEPLEVTAATLEQFRFRLTPGDPVVLAFRRIEHDRCAVNIEIRKRGTLVTVDGCPMPHITTVPALRNLLAALGG